MMVVACRSHIVSTSSMDRVMMVVTMTCGSHIVSTSVIASRIMVVMVSGGNDIMDPPQLLKWTPLQMRPRAHRYNPIALFYLYFN
jgi:hypothetical protein